MRNVVFNHIDGRGSPFLYLRRVIDRLTGDAADLTRDNARMFVGGIVGLLALSACGGRVPAATRQQATTCDGRRYIEVRNALDVPVDIYVAPIHATEGRQFLGTVRPGVTTLPLPEPLYFFYAHRDTGVVYRRDVDVRYGCDRS